MRELLAARDAIEQGQAQAADAARTAQRRAELAALAVRGDAAWQEVEDLIAEQKKESYRQAAKLLEKLGQLAADQGQSPLFTRRLDSIRAKYSRRPALLQELRQL